MTMNEQLDLFPRLVPVEGMPEGMVIAATGESLVARMPDGTTIAVEPAEPGPVDEGWVPLATGPRNRFYCLTRRVYDPLLGYLRCYGELNLHQEEGDR